MCLLAIVACLVAGCGAGGAGSTSRAGTASSGEAGPLDASQTLAAVQAAAHDARSVHVVGTIARAGRRTTLDLRLRDGGEGQGTIETTGGRIQLVRAGRSLYFAADVPTLTRVLGPDRATRAAGRFVTVSAGDRSYRSFLDLLDMDSLFDTLLTPKGAVSRVAGIVVDGTATVGLHDDDPDAGGVLYVAASGVPYPLLLTPDDRRGGVVELRMREWNADVQITPPPPDMTVAISDLE